MRTCKLCCSSKENSFLTIHSVLLLFVPGKKGFTVHPLFHLFLLRARCYKAVCAKRYGCCSVSRSSIKGIYYIKCMDIKASNIKTWMCKIIHWKIYKQNIIINDFLWQDCQKFIPVHEITYDEFTSLIHIKNNITVFILQTRILIFRWKGYSHDTDGKYQITTLFHFSIKIARKKWRYKSLID